MFGARQCNTARVRHKLQSAALHIQASSCFNRTQPLSAQVSQLLSPPDESPRLLAYSCTSSDMASSSGCCPADILRQHDTTSSRASVCEAQRDTTQPIETKLASKRPSSKCSIPTVGESANRRKEPWFGQRVWTHAPPMRSTVNVATSTPLAPSQESMATSAGQVTGVRDTAGSSNTSVQPQGWAFSVMCYNILADTYAHRFASKLYRDVPKACLEWPARRALLLEEIRHWAPDVVCLQEVQHFQDLEPEMRAAGYEGHFMRRGGRRRDGCATFWRADRLRACAVQRLDYLSLGLDDNVAMLLSLAPRAGADCDSSLAASLSSVRLLVATVHVSFDPTKGEVKLAQVRTLLNQTAQLTTQPPPEEPTVRGATQSTQPASPGPASQAPTQRSTGQGPGASTGPLPLPTFQPDDPGTSLQSTGCQAPPHLPLSLSAPSQLSTNQGSAGQGPQSQPQLQLPTQIQTQTVLAGSDATGERHRHKSPPRAAASAAAGVGDGRGSGGGGVSNPFTHPSQSGQSLQSQSVAMAPQQQPLNTLAIITGDFNSTAGSPLYQYVARGVLDLSTTSRKKLSGQLHGVCHAQYKPVPEVKQLHAQITAAAAAASDAAAATVAAASASSAAINATAASPPVTPREPSAAAATAAALAVVASARDAAAAAIANACAAAASAATHPPTVPPAARASVASRMLERLLSAFGRSSAEGWTERELRCALGEQYTHPNHQRPPQQQPAYSSQAASAPQSQSQPPVIDGTQGLHEADMPAPQLHLQSQEARAEVARSSSCGGVGGNGGEEAVGRRTRRSMSQPVSKRHSLDNGPGGGAGGSSAGGSCGGSRDSMDSRPPAEAWSACGTQPSSGRLVVRHPLRLRSAYMEVARAEPAFTSIHSGFMGTVDFIWYTGDSIVQQSGAGVGRARQGIDTGGVMSSAHTRISGASSSPAQCGAGAGSAVASVSEATGAGPAGCPAERSSSFVAPDPAPSDVSSVNSATIDGRPMGGAVPRFSLVPVAVLQPPDLDALPHGLPAMGWGSDHISIMTRFELRSEVSSQ